jgi:hypothetical protein
VATTKSLEYTTALANVCNGSILLKNYFRGLLGARLPKFGV